MFMGYSRDGLRNAAASRMRWPPESGRDGCLSFICRLIIQNKTCINTNMSIRFHSYPEGDAPPHPFMNAIILISWKISD